MAIPPQCLVRVVLPATSATNSDDVSSFCKALEGEFAMLTLQPPTALHLVSLDLQGAQLVADFSVGPGAASLAARLGAQLAGRASGVHLMLGGQVQLVMQKVKTAPPLSNTPAGGDLPPAPPKVPLIHPHWRPLCEPCPLGSWKTLTFPEADNEEDEEVDAKLDDEVVQLLRGAKRLAAQRRRQRPRVREMQEVVDEFRPALLKLLRRLRRLYERKVQACLRVQRYWRGFRSLTLRALRQRRRARGKLQSWCRGALGRRAAKRRRQKLREWSPLILAILGPWHSLYRVRWRIAAAICIQTYWRGSCARAKLARRRAIYRQLQAAARGALPLGAVELVVATEVIQEDELLQVHEVLHHRALTRFHQMQQQSTNDADTTATVDDGKEGRADEKRRKSIGGEDISTS